jgi:hypothetical protein
MTKPKLSLLTAHRNWVIPMNFMRVRLEILPQLNGVIFFQAGIEGKSSIFSPTESVFDQSVAQPVLTVTA